MTQIAFKCPDPDMDAEVAVAECLNCSRTRMFRTCDYNFPILQMMVEVADERVSPTRLQSCPRQAGIKRRYEYVVDPRDQWAKVRGTLVHIGLASVTGEGTDQGEIELTRPLDDVLISGRADLISPQQGLITDWKTTAYIRKDHAPQDHHIGQLSVYRWLAQGRGWDVAYGELMYMDMRRPKRYVVDLWPEERVEAWLRERVPPLLQAYDDKAPLAPVLAEEAEDGWQCKYCSVSKICAQLAQEGQ